MAEDLPLTRAQAGGRSRIGFVDRLHAEHRVQRRGVEGGEGGEEDHGRLVAPEHDNRERHPGKHRDRSQHLECREGIFPEDLGPAEEKAVRYAQAGGDHERNQHASQAHPDVHVVVRRVERGTVHRVGIEPLDEHLPRPGEAREAPEPEDFREEKPGPEEEHEPHDCHVWRGAAQPSREAVHEHVPCTDLACRRRLLDDSHGQCRRSLTNANAVLLPPRGRQIDLALRVLRWVLCLDLREWYLEPALLQDLVGPRGVDQVLRQLGHRQHLDQVQERGGVTNHILHVLVDAVVHDVAHVAAAHDLRILARHGHPEHLLAEALGVPVGHLHDLHVVLGLRPEQVGVEFGLEPALDDVRTLFDQLVLHGHEAAIQLANHLGVANALGDAFHDDLGRGWLPHDRAVKPPGLEVRSLYLDVLVQVLRRFDVELAHRLLAAAVGAATLRHRDALVAPPLHRLFGRLEVGRLVARQEDAALVVGEAQYGHHAQLAHVALADRHDGGHVAHVADVVFVGEHGVADDGALQTDLPRDRGALGQVLLPWLHFLLDHSRPSLGVVRLVADYEMPWLAGFTVVLRVADARVQRTQTCHGGP